MPRPVKRTRDADASRARVFAAAAEEFAAHGFDGATVDRIAERAGVNKAMVYYHYADKSALYGAVLGDMFASVAVQLRTIRAAGGSPEAQVAAFVDVIAREGRARPHFPGMWLRELADGGAHLGPGNHADMLSIVSTLRDMLRDGTQAGRFRAMAPFPVQMGIVGPLFLFMATRGLRQRLSERLPGTPIIADEDFIEYVKHMTLGALAEKAARAPRKARRGAGARTRPTSKAGTR